MKQNKTPEYKLTEKTVNGIPFSILSRETYFLPDSWSTLGKIETKDNRKQINDLLGKEHLVGWGRQEERGWFLETGEGLLIWISPTSRLDTRELIICGIDRKNPDQIINWVKKVFGNENNKVLKFKVLKPASYNELEEGLWQEVAA